MFYAVRLCSNSSHERYQRPIEFITEGGHDDDWSPDPLERETEEEIREALKDNMLYKAGWVEIIEI